MVVLIINIAYLNHMQSSHRFQKTQFISICHILPEAFIQLSIAHFDAYSLGDLGLSVAYTEGRFHSIAEFCVHLHFLSTVWTGVILEVFVVYEYTILVENQELYYWGLVGHCEDNF